MKRLFSAFILATLLFAACSEDEPQVKQPVLTLLSEDTIEVTSSGGEFTIEYSLENQLPETPILVTCDAAWIKDLTTAFSITFRVESNSDFIDRETEIRVEHATESFTVKVVQSGIELEPDVEFQAPKLNGEYIGNTHCPGYNYFLILSTHGTTGWSALGVDTYYRIDLYSDVPASDASAAVVPPGVYRLDTSNSGVPGTFSQSHSVRFDITESSFVEDKVNYGTVVVTETGLEATFMYKSGVIHRVTYEGSLVLRYDSVEEPDHYTFLTEDYIFAHENATLRAFYYADHYGLGYGNWTIHLMETVEPINGDFFLLDIVTDNMEYTQSALVGDYLGVSPETELDKNTFFAGFGSQYRVVDSDYIDNYSGSYLFEGNIKIEESGTGLLVTIDCLDDLGHKISGTFDCPKVELHMAQQ